MAKRTNSGDEKSRNRDEVIASVFREKYQAGMTEIPFTMDEIRSAIQKVSQKRPTYRENNVADVRYEYTSGRRQLPDEVNDLGPWMIQGRGKGRYAFVKLGVSPEVSIAPDLATIFIPDATPEIVLEYAGADEQGVLAKLNYNRLLDIFLQLTCYHLQNHWRTSIKGKGQIEVDDLYVGLNTKGQQFVIPIEAKCANDQLSKTQIVQMIAFARERYSKLVLKPVGVQEMKDGSLVLIEFTPASHPDDVKIAELRRYKLVSMSEVPAKQQEG